MNTGEACSPGIGADVLNRFAGRIHAFSWMTNHLQMLVQLADQPLGKILQRIATLTELSRYLDRDPANPHIHSKSNNSSPAPSPPHLRAAPSPRGTCAPARTSVPAPNNSPSGAKSCECGRVTIIQSAGSRTSDRPTA